jgi:hypothetical protein
MGEGGDCEACSIKSERETEGILQKAVVGQEGKDIPRWGGGEGGVPSRFFLFLHVHFFTPDIFRLGNNNRISCDFKQGRHPCTIIRFPKHCKKTILSQVDYCTNIILNVILNSNFCVINKYLCRIHRKMPKLDPVQ